MSVLDKPGVLLGQRAKTTVALPRPTREDGRSPGLPNTPTFPSYREFRAWRKLNPDRGEPGDPAHCPIAECLRDRGFDAPIVGAYAWRQGIFMLGDDDLAEPLPPWATNWVACYDLGVEPRL